MQVIVRAFDPVSDSGIIYSSYPKGVYYGSLVSVNPTHDAKIKSNWFKQFHKQMRSELENSEVLIACMADNPSIILGYAIITDSMLEFIYVKEMFRNQGIAKLLLKNHSIEGYRHITKVGNAILHCRDKES